MRRVLLSSMGVAPAALAALAGLVALPSAGAPAAAGAGPRVTLKASFAPDRLGAPTTIGFEFAVARDGGAVPPPITHMVLKMPAGLSYTTSTLGLAICHPQALIEKGLTGCSPNARLGHGSAFVEVPFGTGAGREIPDIEALLGPPENGNVVVLFYANGEVPVYAQIVFSAQLLSASGPFGMALDAPIPLIPSVTNGPPVSILRVSSTIGPGSLTYYKHVHGRLVGYHPRGIEVPERCPRGGFPFFAQFTFMDGSVTQARTAVPCPRVHRRHRRHK